MNKIFYKDASICIFVYDITDIKSFNALKEYWYQEIKDSAPRNIVLGLAANKSDLYEKEVVSEEMARNLAKEINAIFMYTSASTFIGIDELFYSVGCKYIDPNYKVGEISLKDIQKNIQKKKDENINKKDSKDNKHKNKKIKIDKKSHKDAEGKKKKKC